MQIVLYTLRTEGPDFTRILTEEFFLHHCNKTDAYKYMGYKLVLQDNNDIKCVLFMRLYLCCIPWSWSLTLPVFLCLKYYFRSEIWFGKKLYRGKSGCGRVRSLSLGTQLVRNRLIVWVSSFIISKFFFSVVIINIQEGSFSDCKSLGFAFTTYRVNLNLPKMALSFFLLWKTGFLEWETCVTLGTWN